MKCHFGKHKGKEVSDIESGYLRWAVENVEPTLPQKYRNNADGSPMTAEQVRKYEEQTRDFLSEAEDELLRREEP